MKRNRVDAISLFSLLLLPSLFAFAASPTKPNVIVIVADDLGYADVGFNGCKDISTPNIDLLARQGVRFSNGYVSHPACSPTRAGLLTGRYQERFGHENNPPYLPQSPMNNTFGLPTNQITLADVLKKAGYQTIAVGKWHLGGASCFHPNVRGFTEFFGFPFGDHSYLPTRDGDKRFWNSLNRNGQPVPETEYLTDAFSREAVNYIEKFKAKPFFLYLAYNAVHLPLEATKIYLDRFPGIADEKRRTYAAMTSAMDDGIGRVLNALHKNNLDRDTLIIFLSDNGGPRRDSVPAHNEPLRGYKGDLYEGGIRVPFVMRWPGRLPSGKVYNDPVCSIDIYPTAAAVAGAKVPSDRKMDGVNLIPYLLGQQLSVPHPQLFWRVGGGTAWAVREGGYKLVWNGSELRRDTPGELELYDLQTDIGETRNLAQHNGEIVRRLRRAHCEWNAELVPPLFDAPSPATNKTPAKIQDSRISETL